MVTRSLAAAAIAGLLLSAAPIAQSGSGPQTQTPTVQQQNEEIIKELRAIRQLLERLTEPQRPPQTARLTNLKGYALGSPDAPLTMVEFTDLQCPFCRQFAMTTFESIKRNWIDTGRLRYISRDLPLDALHAQATSAARAARCSGEQGKFWEMRWTLMKNANLLSPAYITKVATDLKLDLPAFSACTASSKYDADIQADMDEAQRIGIAGTPTFIVGKTTPAGIEGPLIVGALDYSRFDARFKEVLGK
jgi:protein-disulfide isomerase